MNKAINKKELVSIIIPIHNNEEYLDECLKSIIGQTYTNLEIILVDDDSKDKSLDIIKKYSALDKRIKYFSVNFHNAALARKVGIDKASAEYVCFVDSDDIVHEKYVEVLLGSILSNNFDLATAKISRFLRTKDINYDEIKDSSYVHNDAVLYFFENYFSPNNPRHISQSINSKMFNISALKGLDYSPIKNTILEDNYIMPQILSNIENQKISMNDSVIYFYRYNVNSTMSNILDNYLIYDNRQINYVEYFNITANYIHNIFKGYNGDIDKLICEFKIQEYSNIAHLVTGKNLQIKDLQIKVDKLNNELKDAKNSNKELQEEFADFRNMYNAIVESKSWRLTKILRDINKIF